jgi:hypothetical protein
MNLGISHVEKALRREYINALLSTWNTPYEEESQVFQGVADKVGRQFLI